MAEEKEIFNILKDANGDGEAPDLRQGGNAENTANAIPTLIVKDDSDNLQYLKTRPVEHAMTSEAGTPVFAFKKASNDGAIYPVTDDLGRLIVTTEGVGTIVRNNGSGTVATAGVEENAVIVGLSLTKIYDDIEINVSSFKDCTWRLVYRDDAGGASSDTEIDQFRTGAGQYTLKVQLDNYQLDTSAGTGTQELRLEVKQRSGSGSDFSASIGAKCSDA